MDLRRTKIALEGKNVAGGRQVALTREDYNLWWLDLLSLHPRVLTEFH
jgi:hypothetical protein